MREASTRIVCGVALMTILAASHLCAQTAELSGLILDPSKLPVPKAQILVQNAATAATRSALSNQQGIYSVPALLPGLYNITVQANGFKTVHQNDVALEIDRQARLDFALEVGTKEESIVVEASAPCSTSPTAR